ncbi:hypothetical protein [Haloplanus rubicundus]|nr:hypothetical protein [Haloplanus rubicundus]
MEMYRRTFLRDLVATTAASSAARTRNQTTDNNQLLISLPELDDGWSDYESITSPENGRYDWTGVIAERADLTNEAAAYADSPPALFSYFAVKASFPDDLRSLEARTSVDMTGGGDIFPISVRIDRVGEYIKSQTCGLDPHPSEVRNFAQELFIDRIGSLHKLDEEPSIEDGLRKDFSPNCMNSRSYSKTRYLDYQYTVGGDWEASESDELEDISFKGYFSIEFGETDYLLVGGMIPDEEVSIGFLGEEIVPNEGELANTLIDLMEQTALTD